jgi:phosphoribosylaminoimidazole-succinocarboxamide synthase
MDRQTAADQLPHVLTGTDFTQILGPGHLGKVRESYRLGGQRIMIATDRISTFDFHTGCVPFKGQILTDMAAFWFEKTRDIVANHLLDVPGPNITRARECKPYPVEMVVRQYITGVTGTSMWVQYENGARNFCGHSLPEGLRKNSRLPEAIITPSTKESEKGAHDRSVSPAELLAETGISADKYEEIAGAALRLFARGSEIAAQAGYLLVDTKYEFGADEDGNLVLIDEIHTPDSSRFWLADTYEENFGAEREMDYFDKEYVRLWLASRGLDRFGQDEERAGAIPRDLFIDTALRYAKVYEDITGAAADYTVGDPMPRMTQCIESLAAQLKTA